MNSTYLSKIVITNPDADDCFPFDLPFLRGRTRLEIDTENPVTILVGDNGVGKSTLLESLAYNVGFNVYGGGKNHYYDEQFSDDINLAKYMKLIWHRKTSRGFFMRAESFVNFSSYIDEIAKIDSRTYEPYGGQSLNTLSHGQAFLALFENKFRDGIFILDEPEAALAPSRILSLISVIHGLVKSGGAQFIIATHSPILMTYPNARLYEFSGYGLKETDYESTEHFQLTKGFLLNPERYYRYLFEDEDGDDL